MQVIKIPDLPAGCYKKNCDPPESSGEAFRDDVLIPALKKGMVLVNLDPKYGVPVSWNEEVFGGLVRKLGAGVMDRIALKSIDHMDSVNEALNFMYDQVKEQE